MRGFLRLITGLLLVVCGCAAQNDSTLAHNVLDHAKQLYTQEGPTEALPLFENALKDFRTLADRSGEAITLGYIANCYRKLEQLDKALEFANLALKMKQELNDRDEIGKTHNQLGLIYWERADYPSAIQHFQQAIDIASAVDDKQLEGSAHNNLGLVFDEQGDHKLSLEQYQHALELNRTVHFERGESDALGDIGGVYLLLGKFRDALPYYQQALAIDERLALKPASSIDLVDIALCLSATGDVDGALQSFDRASRIAHGASLPKEEADARKGKASTLVGLGRFDQALREYAAAEQVYEHAGLKRELLEALIDTGHVDELLGDGNSANSEFTRALQIAREIGNASGESSSLIALGDLEHRRKRYDTADAYFQQALKHSEGAGHEGLTIEALVESSLNDIDRQHLDSALQSASQAGSLAERNGNQPAVAFSHYVLGEVQRSQANYQSALGQYAAALDLQKSLRDPELGWQIFYGQGQALAADSKDDAAVSAYKQAIQIIEDTRSALAEERYRAGYIEDRYQVYVALVELLLKLHRPEDAFLYSEKLRARAYFDQLGRSAPKTSDPATQQRLRELSQQLHSLRRAVDQEYSTPPASRRGTALDEYSAELARAEREYAAVIESSSSGNPNSSPDAHVLSSSDVQHELAPRTAIVEYVVGRQALSILFVTGNGVNGLSIPITSASLASRSELLRTLIAARSPDWIEPARGLRQILIDPLDEAGYLSSIRELLIVPDGILNYVPFSALPVSKQGFLADRFTLAYLPAASALTRSSEASSRKLLAMAPSDAHLPNAPAEVEGIGQIFGAGSRVIVGKRATKTVFKQIAGDYDYVHLATHGNLNRSAPALSALELEPDGDDDGWLQLYEIADLKLHARLITLSACETGLGTGYFAETPGGDEFVGLTRAFLGAGGHNVLASLWPVSDQSTRDFMLIFYKHLLADGGPEALTRAEQELRRSEPRYRHPYYWAPFILSGSIN